VTKPALLDRLDELRDRLSSFNARIVRAELPAAEVWDRAWRMFAMRRMVVAQGADLVIMPSARPLLEYYANSIRHLLPAESTVAFSPADEGDPTLPRLATRDEMDPMTRELPVVKKGIR
jgi:Glycerol-3-phosphate acyltransferase C-terminal region